MATTTVPARTRATPPTWQRARSALTAAAGRAAAMASTARARYRRPALVIAAFGCADASAWHTFGLGAGLLAMAGSLLALELLSGEDGTP